VPLGRLPGRRLERLIRVHLDVREDALTRRLIAELRRARARGYLTPAELQAVCRWKSPRAIRLVRANGARQVRALTGRALGSRDEEGRLRALTRLRGVSVPMASAVLTLLHPRRYGVIDIRVWQLLHAAGAVSGSPRGVGLGFAHWRQFLEIVRRLAATLGVSARCVELALFHVHREYQRGRLYEAGAGRPPAGRRGGRDRPSRGPLAARRRPAG
jgi:hypothetical protein